MSGWHYYLLENGTNLTHGRRNPKAAAAVAIVVEVCSEMPETNV